jgi:hypothetical protein
VLATDVLSQTEAALLGGALLWAIGVPARLGTAAGLPTTGRLGLYCHWSDRGTWRVLAPWADGAAEQARSAWEAAEEDPTRLLTAYRLVVPRALPLAATAARLSARLREERTADALGGGRSARGSAGPPCPRCGSPMRERSGKRGPFWGCSTYPDCRGTRPLADEQGRED